MPRPPQDVTDAELSVLQHLWDSSEPPSVRQLTDRIYPKGNTSDFATVQKLLERLEGKGFVKRQREASPLRFAPTVTRDQLIGRRLKSIAEKLCGGSLTPLLTQLVQSDSLDPRERRELRGLIDRLDRRAKDQR